jgi:membrane protease YdiL (CAAX protease family)
MSTTTSRRLLPLVLPVAVFGLGWALLVLTRLPLTALGHEGILSDSTVRTLVHKTLLTAVALLIMLFNRRSLGEFGFRWARRVPWMRVIVIGLLIGTAGTLAILVTPAGGMGAALGMSFLQIVLVVWLHSSITEEIFTRGLIQSLLDSLKDLRVGVGGIGVSVPVLTAAVLFATMHLSLLAIGVDGLTVCIVVTMTLVLGLVAGVVRERYDSLLPAIVVHVAGNVGGVMAGVLYAIGHVIIHGHPPALP